MPIERIIVSLSDIVEKVSPLEFEAFVADLRSWHLSACEGKADSHAMVWHDDGLVGKKE